MGLKLDNRYYSNKDITPVLARHGYNVVNIGGALGLQCYRPVDQEPTKTLDAYEVFKKIVNKRLNQSKQQFLDSL